jgi:hypothetical protein
MPTDAERYNLLLQALSTGIQDIRQAFEVAFGVELPSAATLNEELERIARQFTKQQTGPDPVPSLTTSPLPEPILFTGSTYGRTTAKTSLSTSPALRTSLSRGRPIALHVSGGQTPGLRSARKHVSWQIVGAEMTTADTA